MGGCQGTRKTYTEKSQKLCRAFEDQLRLFSKDWKVMVALVRSYAQQNGDLSPESITKIMEEAGLKDVYCNNDTKLRELLTQFMGEQKPQYEPLSYFMLFMCSGRETEKAEYLCLLMNNMDPTKTIVSCEKLCTVLEQLMRMAVVTIPEMVGSDKFEDFEAMKAADIASMLKQWCPDCAGETVTRDKLTEWVTKRRAFTPGEARAIVIETIRPAKAPATGSATDTKETQPKPTKVTT